MVFGDAPCVLLPKRPPITVQRSHALLVGQRLLLGQSGLLNIFGDGQKLDRRRYLQSSSIAHIFLEDKNS